MLKSDGLSLSIKSNQMKQQTKSQRATRSYLARRMCTWSDCALNVKYKIKQVTLLGKAVWQLSCLMALPLAEILYHHTTQPPYLLPGRLVLLSISSLAPKCPSIICHAIFFSAAALTPGLLFLCVLLLHVRTTSHILVFTPQNAPLSLTLGINL